MNTGKCAEKHQNFKDDPQLFLNKKVFFAQNLNLLMGNHFSPVGYIFCIENNNLIFDLFLNFEHFRSSQNNYLFTSVILKKLPKTRSKCPRGEGAEL
jgi:hypothetical protein